MESNSKPSHPWIQLLLGIMEVGFAVGVVRLFKPLIIILAERMPEISLGEWTIPTKWVAVGMAVLLLFPLIAKGNRLLRSLFWRFI